MHPIFNLPESISPASSAALATVYALNNLSVFEAKGLDALTFLQGQLTNDIVAPGVGHSCLAGYCTAQGRLLSTMVLGQSPDPEQIPTVKGMMRTDILAPVLKRLSMFVLRSKVTLLADSASVVGVTALASNRSALISQLGHSLPEAIWETTHASTGTWIAAPRFGVNEQNPALINRWWWIAGQANQEAVNKLQLNVLRSHSDDWDCQDIQLGIPWIEARTQDLFIPQTLNLELIGGVSFTKGCYPGQEIVARSHYRGTVKKRMALGKILQSGDFELIPGADIFDATAPDQPCGRLINVSQQSGPQGIEHCILFETTFDAYDRQQLRAAAAIGPAIKTFSLPYPTRSS